MIKYQEISYDGRLKRNEPQQSTLPLLRTCDGEFDAFPIKIGLHQGSALSSYIFTLVINEITKDI
jgi:hypothetical protein